MRLLIFENCARRRLKRMTGSRTAGRRLTGLRRGWNSGRPEGGGKRPLPLAVQGELYRIALEALNNSSSMPKRTRSTFVSSMTRPCRARNLR